MLLGLTGVVRVAVALATVLVAQSVFWAQTAPWQLEAIVVALAALACWRPAWGLIALAGLAPFGRMIAIVWLGAFPVRGTEALALAVLAGIAVRHVGVRTVRPRLPAWAAGPWLLLAAVIVASAAVLYRVFQFHLDYPGAFFVRLLEFLAFDYHGLPGENRPWLEPAGFNYVVAGALVLEGIGLLLITARLCLDRPAFARHLLMTTVAAGAVAAAMSIEALIAAARATADPFASLGPLISGGRWAVHVNKVNTAGSYFVLVAPIAAGLAAFDARRRWWWLAAVVLLAAATWLTASLAAILPAVLLAAAALAVWAWKRSGTRHRVAAATALVAVVAFGAVRLGTRPDAAESFGRRLHIMRMSLDTAAEAPVFGVGIGRYPFRSQPHVTAAVRDGFGEGGIAAHNYLLQVLAELGAVGFAIFIWAVGLTIGLTWTRHARRLSPWGPPATLGVLAFLASSLSGQPMLVDSVAIPVWIVMGVLFGQVSESTARSSEYGWVAAGVMALLLTIPVRMALEARALDPAQAARGARRAHGEDRLVWILEQPARLFVRGTAVAIDFDVRRTEGHETGDVFLRVEGAGRSVLPVRLGTDWRRICVDLDQAPRTGPRAVDLRAVTAEGADAEPGSAWVAIAGRDRRCGV